LLHKYNIEKQASVYDNGSLDNMGHDVNCQLFAVLISNTETTLFRKVDAHPLTAFEFQDARFLILQEF
jgi:hypothetical protein